MPMYGVTSPEYNEVEYIDHFIANITPVSDWYLVNALTAKEARWAAYRRAKENMDGWVINQDGHPLRGLRVEVMNLNYPTTEYDEELEEYIETGEYHDIDPMSFAGKKYYIDLLAKPEPEFIL